MKEITDVILATGHTNATALAVERCNKAVAAVIGDSFYPHSYRERFVTFRMDALLTKLAQRMGVSRRDLLRNSSKVGICVAGGAHPDDQRMITDCFAKCEGSRRLGAPEVLDDTWAGLIAGSMCFYGTSVFAGTGASVFVGKGLRSIRNNRRKFDGWGSIIGDFGSGFQLAVDMFRELNRIRDGGRKPPKLFKRAAELDPHIEGIDNVQKWFDSIFISDPFEWRIRFAALAEAATKAADLPKPDPLAKRLVRQAAVEIGNTLEAAVAAFPEAKKMPIVFHGGMFENSNLFLGSVERRAKSLTTAPVGLARYRPIVGAAILACDMRKADVAGFLRSIARLPGGEQCLLLRKHPKARLPQFDGAATEATLCQKQ